MKITRLAAIDVGSNAMRLLISNVIHHPKKGYKVKKATLIRLPIRLGKDAFTKQKIGKKNRNRLSLAMESFKNMMVALDVKDYRACATSAMREAENGPEIVESIFKNTGINIEIIDGKEEADILYSTHIAQLLKKNKAYLYVDVGGGSTEITVFHNGKIINSDSFKIGTVRMLNGKVKDKSWNKMASWLRSNLKDFENSAVIGSGGNINKLHKMSRLNQDESLHREYLKFQLNYLNSFTYKQRITELEFNPDRADVIIPAAEIFLFILEKSKISEIFVPRIGISDGIVKQLATKHFGKA